MKYQLAASALLSLAAAVPQAPFGGHGGPPSGVANGALSGVPSCMSSCLTADSGCSSAEFSCLCGSGISSVNSCISSSSCDDSDKSAAYQALAQLCANVGVTATATPEATFSATSGGSAWPTNSAWASALSSWKTHTTATSGSWGSSGAGWSGAVGHGPFGQGGSGNGWGPLGNETTGAWTAGPWTSWWGTAGCPPSTWSGWTTGTWSAAPSWTAWTACTATTTATNVVTTTVTTGSTTGVITTTNFGIKVDQASNTASSTTSGSGAHPTDFGVAGAAAGVVGIIAGAVLL